MIRTDPDESAQVNPPARDGVRGLDGDPLIVSISDVHGFLGAARSALTTLGDHPDYDSLVRTDDEGRLHWAGGDEYVLVFNGDLVDRGPDSAGVVAMVERLRREAPPGHVRTTVGNHEWGMLFPAVVNWSEWYSGQRSDEERRRLCDAIARGHLVATYDGYNFTYAHAGQPSRYRSERLNDRLVEAAGELSEVVGTEADADTQRRLIDEYDRVLGMGRQGGRGFGAGIAWLDFRYLPGESPPQVVGHTRQDQPVQKNNVVCENVIRATQADPGGDAVLVESPDSLVSLERTYDGEVHVHQFDVPDGSDGKV
ncbi:MAG: metallophosphoesterase [Haloarculaceae archaeon]